MSDSDYMRSDDHSYRVMLLDTFYRDYHNPLANYKLREKRSAT